MNWTTQCAAVIPCLNESASIASVITSVRRFVPTVVVIDDGSQDDTSALAETAGAEVIRHAQSRGKGAALRTGWEYATKRGFSWALTLDGDGQHSAHDIPKFLAAVELTGAELVIGNRMTQPKGMPWLRQFVNRWMSRRLSTLAGFPLPDSQCGFRLMNLETWAKLPVQAAHFEIESDVLLSFAVERRAVEFVPIEVIYKNEQSKIHPLRDTLRWMRWWRRASRHVAARRAARAFSNRAVPIPPSERKQHPMAV